MSANPKTPQASWQQIVAAVETLGEQSKSDLGADEFNAEAIKLLVSLTDSASGKLWCRQPSSNWDDTQTESAWFIASEFGSTSMDTDCDQPESWRSKAIAGQKTVRQLDHQRSIWWCPVRGDEAVCAVIQLNGADEDTAEHRQGTEQLLTVVSELIADRQQVQQYRLLKDREQFRGEFDRFTQSIHESLDVDRVAYTIANQGRSLSGGDRLTVLLSQRRKLRVIAVSGVETIDRRSGSVQEMETVAAQHRTATEPVWIEQTPDTLDDHVSGKATLTALVPMRSLPTGRQSNRHNIGMLLVEWFAETSPSQRPALQSRTTWISQHAARALENAVRSGGMPLSGLSRWLDKYFIRGRGVSIVSLLLLASIAAVLALVYVEVDFQIEARGELQPLGRETIFAPRDAMVVGFPDLESLPEHAVVKIGAVVVQLDSAELQYELTTLLGEQSTVTQQLDTIAVTRSQLGQSGGSFGSNRDRFDELSAQSLELQVRGKSLAERIRLLEKQQRSLSVTAGIGGQVMTWDFTRKLRGRPVVQGDRLLEIVDTAGPWQLHLFVPDQHIGYVLDAAQAAPTALPISFIEKSNPTIRHTSQIVEMGMSTEVVAGYGATVRVIGSVENTSVTSTLRPGTTVIAQVECGKRSLGFVWLHDLIDAIRMRLLF